MRSARRLDALGTFLVVLLGLALWLHIVVELWWLVALDVVLAAINLAAAVRRKRAMRRWRRTEVERLEAEARLTEALARYERLLLATHSDD